MMEANLNLRRLIIEPVVEGFFGDADGWTNADNPEISFPGQVVGRLSADAQNWSNILNAVRLRGIACGSGCVFHRCASFLTARGRLIVPDQLWQADCSPGCLEMQGWHSVASAFLMVSQTAPGGRSIALSGRFPSRLEALSQSLESCEEVSW